MAGPVRHLSHSRQLRIETVFGLCPRYQRTKVDVVRPVTVLDKKERRAIPVPIDGSLGLCVVLRIAAEDG